MATLDDIWDEPAEATPARPRPTPRTDDDEEGAIAPSRRRQALFLDSDDDEPSPSARKPTAAPDLDDVFAGLGDDDDDGPTPQTPARGARASSPFTPHAVLPSSSPPRDWKDGGAAAPAEGAPKKRVQAKLDEARLLGSDGFPALLKQTRGFVPKGKGHEQADLNRLMSLYQFWAHRMYPKTQFRDTVKTVEKLCHSKRMHVALSTWRDEAKGLVNGMEPQPDADMAAASDDDDDGDMHPPRDVPVASSRATSPFRAASRGPPTSGSEPEDEWDVDAAIREEEELERTRTKVPPAPRGDMDMDDEDFWEESVVQQKTSAPAPAPAPVSDDDLWAEMDDAMMDMDEPVSLTTPAPAVAAKPQQAAATVDDDWDDLYA